MSQAELEKELTQIQALQAQVKKLSAQLDLAQDFLYLPGSQEDKPLKLSEVQVFTKAGPRVEVWDCWGNKFASDTTLDLNALERQLADYPQFIRSHDSFIVNLNQLDYFEPSPTEHKGRQLSMRLTGHKAPLSSSKVIEAKSYFKLVSVVHVTPWDKRYQAILDENLREFDKEIRLMSEKELRRHFRYQTINDFNTREFMANVIWEYYLLLQKGLRPPIEGNIRTFWYYLKPTLSKVIKINSQAHYPLMIDVFKTLVIKHQLFKYKDFGFIDEGQNFYRLGKKHPHIILVGEKTGHFKKLERLQEEFDVTIVATGGMSSILTTEYLVDELEQVTDLSKTPFHLITIVDYNPSGAIIIKALTAQLEHEGIKQLATQTHMLIPQNFTPEELKYVTDQIPLKTKADKTKAQRWIAAGGGIDGKPLGIEAEALILDYERMRGLFEKAFKQITGPVPQRHRKRKYYPEKMDLSDLEVNLIDEHFKLNKGVIKYI